MALGPAALLALQRAAGNAAVASLLGGAPGVRGGTATDALQRQGRAGRGPERGPGRPAWRAPTARQRLIDRLLAPDSPLWQRLNPHEDSTFNCPATAAAVDHFLTTGQVSPAEAGNATDIFRFSQGPLTAARDFDEIRRALARPRSHVTVHGIRDPGHSGDVGTDHWFHVVNDRGTLVVIDAFGPRTVIDPRTHQIQRTQQIWRGDAEIERYLRFQELHHFEYYRGEFHVERAPGIDSNTIPGLDAP